MQHSLVLVLSCVTLLGANGCETVATRAPRPITAEVRSDLAELFPSDAEALSDVEIARALDTSWSVPDDLRIALVELGHRSEFVEAYPGGWSTRPLDSRSFNLAQAAVETLASIDGVFDAAYLPSFMVPSEPSIGRLRGAAARYQADWLLVYSTHVRAAPDCHFFERDELDGVCLVECAVIDTRTGLVLFTARSAQAIAATAAKGEEMPALVQRVERVAVDAAMLENARALAGFVDAAQRAQAEAARGK